MTTPPQHWRGTFRLLPASAGPDSADLREYAAAFLPAYDTLFAIPTTRQGQAANVAAFAPHPTAETGTAAAPILDLDGVLAQVPGSCASAVKQFAESMLTNFSDLYPRVLDEAIVAHGVGVLGASFDGMQAGTSLFWRESNRVRLEVFYPQHALDLSTGELIVATPAPSVGVGTHPQAEAQLGSPNMGSVMQSVATNLAFALPPPWGPFVAAGIALLFGSAFGGSAGDAAELQEISEMLEQAVSAIESAMEALKMSDDQSTITTYFQWCQTQVQVAATTATYDDYNAVVSTLLSTYKPDSTGLLKPCVDLCSFINGATWQDATDQGLQALLSGVTAMISAQQLIAMLASNAASGLEPSHYATVADDDHAQQMLQHWYDAAALVNMLVNGTSTSAAPASPLDWSTMEATLTANPKDLTAANTKLAAAAATLAPESLLSNATQHGWPYAIGRVTLQRRIARFTGFPVVAPYNNQTTSCGGMGSPGTCVTSGSAGWGFTDSVDGTTYSRDDDISYSGCSSQNEHVTSYDDDVDSHWISHVQSVLAQLDPPTAGGGTSTYGDIDTAATALRTAGTTLYTNLPPVPPNVAPTVAITATAGSVGPTSQWLTAAAVRYAVAGVGTSGYGIRGPWSAPVQLDRKTAGATLNLTVLGTPLKGTMMLQVWRQFIFPDAAHGGEPDAYGVPQVLAQPVTPGTDGTWPPEWADTDPALPAIAH